MRKRIIERLAAASHIPEGEIREDSRIAEDLRIDSLALLQLVLETEAELGIRFDDDMLARVKTAGDVIRLVENGASAEAE